MKVLVPDSLQLSLPAPTSEIEYTTYSISTTDFSAHSDAEILVVWMNTSENLAAAVNQLTHLKLVQSLAAGPDQVLAAGFAPHIAVASGRGLHDSTVAEHTLALALALVRNLDGLQNAQKNHLWDPITINEQADPATSHLYTLNRATILIIGFGSIAERLAPLFTELGASVTGVAQSSGVRSGYPVISFEEMPSQLANFNLVISLLPYTTKTEKAFNSEFFASMNSSAIFINVGRGKTLDERALISALRTGQIRKAAIDVTYFEPLDSQSELWDLPGLIITPHISGGRPQEAERLIELNASRILANQEVENFVAR